jgi:hypothetical protein
MTPLETSLLALVVSAVPDSLKAHEPNHGIQKMPGSVATNDNGDYKKISLCVLLIKKIMKNAGLIYQNRSHQHSDIYPNYPSKTAVN